MISTIKESSGYGLIWAAGLSLIVGAGCGWFGWLIGYHACVRTVVEMKKRGYISVQQSGQRFIDQKHREKLWAAYFGMDDPWRKPGHSGRTK